MIKTEYNRWLGVSSWSLLLLLTGLTWWFGESAATGKTIVSILLFTIVIKCHLVIDHFMGLRQVKSFWRVIVHLWVLLIVTAIAVAYWISMP